MRHSNKEYLGVNGVACRSSRYGECCKGKVLLVSWYSEVNRCQRNHTSLPLGA
jgi:hypothetical protein